MDSIFRRGTGLAPSVSLEVDGGSENQNKTVLALCADLLLRGCTKVITLYRLPIHHTHNVLDGYFGKLSQSTKGGVGGRQSLGSCSLSQQDWDKTAENTLKNVDVKVVNTRALYDYVGHYKDCLDPKFTGFGPGTPIRVMQLFLGDATEMFPKGEPLLRYMYMYDNPYYSRVYCDIFRYKLAAQYSHWYPDDPDWSKMGAPIFTSHPPTDLPPLKELNKWDDFDALRTNIINDSKHTTWFFCERY